MLFRKLAIVLALGLGLTACQPGQPVSPDITALYQEVVAYTKQACQFEPTVATVISLLNVGVGAVADVVGKAVCAAVGTIPTNPAPAQFTTDQPYGHFVVNGKSVDVVGHWVKQ